MQSNKKNNNQYSEQVLIRKYLANTLSKEEERFLTNLYESSIEFKDALDGFEHFTVEEYDNWLKESSTLFDDKYFVQNEESLRPSGEVIIEDNKVKEIHPYRRMAIAASVILFLLFGCYVIFTQMQSTSTKLYSKHFELMAYPDMITRGSGEELSTSEKLAISAYNAENYEISIEHFESLAAKYPENVKYGLFLGISYLASNQPDQAINAFSKLEYEDTEYCNDVYWYLGLSLLKLKKKQEARMVFSKLAEKDCYYTEMANEIISRL